MWRVEGDTALYVPCKILYNRVAVEHRLEYLLHDGYGGLREDDEADAHVQSCKPACENVLVAARTRVDYDVLFARHQLVSRPRHGLLEGRGGAQHL